MNITILHIGYHIRIGSDTACWPIFKTITWYHRGSFRWPIPPSHIIRWKGIRSPCSTICGPHILNTRNRYRGSKWLLRIRDTGKVGRFIINNNDNNNTNNNRYKEDRCRNPFDISLEPLLCGKESIFICLFKSFLKGRPAGTIRNCGKCINGYNNLCHAWWCINFVNQFSII